jgi:hypothetical protein
MHARSLLALACLVIAGAVLAQSSSGNGIPKTKLGTAAAVQGLVTVSDGVGISRVAAGNTVIDHGRYVSSSSGSITLRMDKGCDIILKPNQALTVDGAKPCDALWAAIESLGNPEALLLAGAGGPSGTALVPFAVGGAAILLLDGNRRPGAPNPDTGGRNDDGDPGPGTDPGGGPEGGGSKIPDPPPFSPQ